MLPDRTHGERSVMPTTFLPRRIIPSLITTEQQRPKLEDILQSNWLVIFKSIRSGL